MVDEAFAEDLARGLALLSSAAAAPSVRGKRSAFARRRVALAARRRARALLDAVQTRREAVAIAMYGLMSAAVCRYSRRVAEAPGPMITRIAQVRFSTPHVAVSGAHTPGT